MRILMLGWEFPPFIAGGLGVACFGLTKSLDKLGHQVVFVLPKPVDRALSSHVKLLSPAAIPARAAESGFEGLVDDAGRPLFGFQHVEFRGVPASFSSPYPTFDPAKFVALTGRSPAGFADIAGSSGAQPESPLHIPLQPGTEAPPASGTPRGFIGSGGGAGFGYGSDLFGDAERYARLVVALTRAEDMDVIHAHDWLTYPAGIALAAVTGKPLFVHVHSTEFDRAGAGVNEHVFNIEKAGMQAATRVLAVSQMTKSICVRRYGISPDRVDVVYNGVERESSQPVPGAHVERDDRIVLFLGRITMQKGPEYFIAAAKRVLEKVQNVKFVVAGSGDMALRMIELAANMGIGHKVFFTGFLRGADVEKVFRLADCYVMPSVSEPFGIAALEAISHDVPVILSKTSGASEVLSHVLKVDFWDTDEMANKIIAVLTHPPLTKTLREHGAMELHRLTWDEAARRCVESYKSGIAAAAPTPK